MVNQKKEEILNNIFEFPKKLYILKYEALNKAAEKLLYKIVTESLHGTFNEEDQDWSIYIEDSEAEQIKDELSNLCCDLKLYSDEEFTKAMDKMDAICEKWDSLEDTDL